jgi:two-component system, chemotaxis family, protein-glutamate methylesterase/glutaminase
MTYASYDVISIGGSWGGLDAVGRLLAGIPSELEQTIVVVLHRGPTSARGVLEWLLQRHIGRPVTEPHDKEEVAKHQVYLAPADYHLLVDGQRFALSVDERVQYARPSIDVLFESVADAYRERAIGVVLTGTNEDGARGLAAIKSRGGVAVVQDPRTAAKPQLPEAALAAAEADAVLAIEAIPDFLYGLCCR